MQLNSDALKGIWATVLHHLLEQAEGGPVDREIVRGTFWPEKTWPMDATYQENITLEDLNLDASVLEEDVTQTEPTAA